MIISNDDILRAEIEQLKERVQHFEALLNGIPAFVCMYQIDQFDDANSAYNIWRNEQAIDMAVDANEIAFGNDVGCLCNNMLPLDVNMVRQSVDYFKANPGEDIFTGIARYKNQLNECHWLYFTTFVFKRTANDIPWQLVTSGFKLWEPVNCNAQLFDALKEINRLKNQSKIEKISKREHEILKLVSKGLTDREIADILFISERTAQTHRNNLIKKTGNKNTASLVTFAVENGLH